MSADEKKQAYTKPTIAIVKLNPAQAVLSVCSTTSSTASAGGAGALCRASMCKKKASTGDSAGQC